MKLRKTVSNFREGKTLTRNELMNIYEGEIIYVVKNNHGSAVRRTKWLFSFFLSFSTKEIFCF